MPTPVSTARQCLTDEAARALDDAVSVARRRSHSQTTSLHAVSALLSMQASRLRDACARARSAAYSPRLQFRALELCVSVSLDRLPCSKSKPSDSEPPVSNSLMAAIKRSQANQRRHPETFHFYQMLSSSQSQSQTSLSCIKVELKHFILSILDDPIVSRVFGDAGFRSTDIKIAILHPPPVSGFQKSLPFPPGFLCNIPESNRINFPFAVDQEEDEFNFKRIGTVFAKKTSKNPLLIGVCADSVLTGFTDSISSFNNSNNSSSGNGKPNFLPDEIGDEIGGLEVMSIKNEICEFVLGNLSEELMNLKLKELRLKVESSVDRGTVVNFGELKVFLDGESFLKNVVSEIRNLVCDYGNRLWLIGSVGSYEVYMKVLAKFPDLEKDWDLNLLPITSSKQFKSSLMGSFVPFGGFFPAQTELESSLRKPDQFAGRCSSCNEKYEQEVAVVMKGGKTVSVADQQATGLASWLQFPDSDSTKGNNVVMEAKDHGGVLNARIMGLQRKWSDICQRLHHNFPPHDTSQLRARIPFPHPFQPDPMRAEIHIQGSDQESQCRNPSPPVDFFATTSSSSTTSITTDLGLGTIYVSPDPDPRPQARETREIRPRAFDGPRFGKMDEKDFKQLYTALAEKVRYENECIRSISETITRVRTGPGRRHVWFLFSGPDPVGKRKISRALADIVFGSPESLVSIDLNFENQTSQSSSIFNRGNVNFSDPLFRGKTVMEFIAEQLMKKPQSVVLLEHIDKADFVTKDNLSRAVKTGKLSDARGRETRITDAIFVFTTSNGKGEDGKDFLSFTEERILNAKALRMRVSVEKTEPGISSLLLSLKDSVSRNPETSKKRKIIEIGDFEILVPKAKKPKSCFDLNLPIEEPEESDSDTVSETKELWLELFSDQVDEKVVFDPFDFDSRAETILKRVSECFEKSFGKNAVLEIDDEVMVQMLASDWVSKEDNGVENWIETVLYKSFTDVKQKEGVDNESVVKLAAVEGVEIEEDEALCVCLPSRIIVK